jgi:hypothetical protein
MEETPVAYFSVTIKKFAWRDQENILLKKRNGSTNRKSE